MAKNDIIISFSVMADRLSPSICYVMTFLSTHIPVSSECPAQATYTSHSPF